MTDKIILVNARLRALFHFQMWKLKIIQFFAFNCVKYFEVYCLDLHKNDIFLKCHFDLEKRYLPSEKFWWLNSIKIWKSYSNNQNHKSDYSATKSKLKSILINN